MKLSKKLLSLMLCAIMVLGSVAVGSEGFNEVLDAFSVKVSATEIIDSGKCGVNARWNLTDDGVLTVSGTGDMNDYWTEEHPWCLNEDDIKIVIIENGITSIGDGAFSFCTFLTSITIPDSVTSIGEGAFYRCSSITSVTIPDSVKVIMNNAFYLCTGLTSVTISDGVTTIGTNAFLAAKIL